MVSYLFEKCYDIIMEKVILPFKDSIFSGVADSLPDIVEVGIDSILEDGVVKDLPIVGTLMGVKNAFQNIRERNLLKQTVAFIKELNNETLDEKKKQKYKQNIENDSRKAEDELGRILVILDSIIDEEKSVMLGRMYRCYVNEEISWDEFCDFSEIIRRIFLSDLDWLKELYVMFDNQKRFLLEPLIYSTDRLSSIGLVYLVNSPAANGTQLKIERRVGLTGIGKKFCSIIM